MRKLIVEHETKRSWGDRKTTDRYLVLDAGELRGLADKHSGLLSRYIGRFGSDWYGTSYSDFAKKVVIGDKEIVRESEDFLSKIEDQNPLSRGWRNVDDVVGAIPNVPAFLAGHPQCMRRRERVARDNSPLTIYMDLTSSGGIDAKAVQKRGIVLLALVRRLVEHRSVELWVGSSLGGGSKGGSGTCMWRIDTAPLDLARSGFHVSATVMSRGFGYFMCEHELETGGSWPFNDYDYHCRTAKDRLAAVFPGSEIMYVAPIMLGDEMTNDPVNWVKRTIRSYVKTGDDDE